MLQGMSHRTFVTTVMAIGVLAEAASGHAAPPAAERPGSVRVSVALMPPVPDSHRQLRAMMEEAEAIWRPYDVLLTWPTPESSKSARPPDVRLQVKFGHAASTRPMGTSGRPSLGEIQFFEGDRPDNTILLLTNEIAGRVLSAGVCGPRALVDDVIGRATGRVLAHELGHYLLASRVHARNGLMRPSFGSQELTAFDRRALRLDDAALLRLHARLADVTFLAGVQDRN